MERAATLIHSYVPPKPAWRVLSDVLIPPSQNLKAKPSTGPCVRTSYLKSVVFSPVE